MSLPAGPNTIFCQLFFHSTIFFLFVVVRIFCLYGSFDDAFTDGLDIGIVVFMFIWLGETIIRILKCRNGWDDYWNPKYSFFLTMENRYDFVVVCASVGLWAISRLVVLHFQFAQWIQP